MFDLIKKHFATFVQGTMFGFGFCLAAWILFFIFQGVQHSPSDTQHETNSESVITKKESSISFHDVEEIERNNRTYFIGTVKNNGSSTKNSTSIEINLFYKGKFVDQYSTYLSGNLEPGEERYFKISCGCKNEPPAKHDSYKIRSIGDF